MTKPEIDERKRKIAHKCKGEVQEIEKVKMKKKKRKLLLSAHEPDSMLGYLQY